MQNPRPGRFDMPLSAQCLHSFLFIAIAISFALPIANPATIPQSQSLSLINRLNTSLTRPPSSNAPHNTSADSTLYFDDSVQIFNRTENVVIKCNGPNLGYDLDKPSCIEAWRSIPTDQESVNYGPRGQGLFQAPLPVRYLSCKSSP